MEGLEAWVEPVFAHKTKVNVMSRRMHQMDVIAQKVRPVVPVQMDPMETEAPERPTPQVV